MSQTHSYTVTGMTCDHCVAAVTGEVQHVAGVERVDVDLASGALTVTAGDDLDDARFDDGVRAAVEEAGYQLA